MNCSVRVDYRAICGQYFFFYFQGGKFFFRVVNLNGNICWTPLPGCVGIHTWSLGLTFPFPCSSLIADSCLQHTCKWADIYTYQNHLPHEHSTTLFYKLKKNCFQNRKNLLRWLRINRTLLSNFKLTDIFNKT